jgi:hypothetical protein
MQSKLNMKKFTIFLALLPILIIVLLLITYVSAFRLPSEILKNENINGLANYSGNERDFGEYAIRQAIANESYTGARITKIYYGTEIDKYFCIGNDGSYVENTGIQADLESYGLFGIPKEKKQFAGCIKN